MRRRTETTIVTVFLAVNVVVLACGGVLAGLRRYWGGMGLCFFSVVYSAEICVCLLLNHKIESRFLRLETIFMEKPAPDRLGGKFVPISDLILMLIFPVAICLLSILAYNHERWLVLSVLLAVFLIGNSVSTALTVWLKVRTCSKRLEELVSRHRDSSAHGGPGEL